MKNDYKKQNNATQLQKDAQSLSTGLIILGAVAIIAFVILCFI